MKTRQIFAATALLFAFAISSCHNGGGTNTCSGTITATWKVNGTNYNQYNTVTAGAVGSYSQLVFVSCSADGIDRSVSFNFLPYPPAVGTYPIKYKSAHGWPWNGYVSGTYAEGNSNVVTYFSDSTSNTGNFVITSVDTVGKTFTGTFDFTATTDAGNATVNITNGSYSVKYP